MQNAYDAMLCDYVNAESAAKSGGFEQYRYVCACCWEEVHICAADSEYQVTHFRHRSGNNNTECVNYLGIPNDRVRVPPAHQIDFFFSSVTKMFSIGVKYNEEELLEYEKDKQELQVRRSKTSTPIISVPINSNRFYSNAMEIFPIDVFSWEYYVSVSNDSKQLRCDMFKKDAQNHNIYPSFFKIQAGGEENSFNAKLVRGDTLFTNTPYVIIFTYKHPHSRFLSDVQRGETMSFRTMNRDFSGATVVFMEKDDEIEQQLGKWRYKLEAREVATVLWPPAVVDEDAITLNADNVYLYTTFELQAHVNINVNATDVQKIGTGLQKKDAVISKINVQSRTKVFKKNAELIFDKSLKESGAYLIIPIIQKVEMTHIVKDDNAFLFNCSGVSPLSNGMSVPVIPGSRIKHFTYGYLDGIVLPPEFNDLHGEKLLQDILMYYKSTEPFVRGDCESIVLSQTALDYIESCKRTGVINSAAKRLIKEGRI